METIFIDQGTTWLVAHGPGFLANAITFLVILLIGSVVIRTICKVTRRILVSADRVSEILENFTVDVLNKTLWIFLLMVALSQMGIDVMPMIAGLGVAGFIIGFAFQESLGNLAAGLMVLLNQPFKIGDFVEAGGVSGTVRELNLMATTLTTPDNKLVICPNQSIWGASITNYSALETRRVDMVVGISYGADISVAKSLIVGVIEADEQILSDPEPVVEVVEMADSSINLVVRPWCKTEDYWTVYFRLHHALKDCLDTNEIEIPFPQLDVHHYGR
ncbi:MAG: mechanosensitive ion channel [Gemmatimonadetes bacterium]|nr:mechanosensitive ion channel [Gemmatimonadota bacterium]MBT4608471.1 mechanosensitive ion channel [Gemmatimonadota bacterium]MBT5055888.1 mechanosensitive ion channel [Gemmatimonadota bacterium]MBT5141575.1 mechanosensitive ion channel [Gemmatimonadota bacterium]MBT5590878.1 mechanosensitive ion channel [Gemmatimonadota bacterium]